MGLRDADQTPRRRQQQTQRTDTTPQEPIPAPAQGDQHPFFPCTPNDPGTVNPIYLLNFFFSTTYRSSPA